MKFETPIVEVKKFDVADILTASNPVGPVEESAAIYEIEDCGPLEEDT